jgi:hypothetical protein
MPLSHPFRLHVLRQLTACLKQITPAGGYVHDLSNKVYRGRTVFGSETEVPFVSILEVPIPLDQLSAPGDSALSAGGWDLLIQGFVEDDTKNPTDPAHVLMADVRKRLGIERKRVRDFSILGMKEVTDMTIGPGVVRPPDADISSKAYFYLSVTLNLAEDLEDPYGDPA